MKRYLQGIRIQAIAPVLLAASLMLATPLPGFAVGDIAISPTRVVFEGRERTAQISLINTSSEPKTYRISWVRKRMTADGNYEDITEARPGEQFSDSLIRFSPRQVTLPPGKPQRVRLLLRKPSNLKDGEYRSYLRFTAIPSANDRSINSVLNTTQGNMTIRLTPVMSISIPVIVRHGQTQATAHIDQLHLDTSHNGSPRLALRFTHEGNRSLFGDVEVELVPDQGNSRIVGQATGVALYPPSGERRFELPLDMGAITSGTLKVRFRTRSQDGQGDNNGVLATAELAVH